MTSQTTTSVIDEIISKKRELRAWFTDYQEDMVDALQNRYKRLKEMSVPDVIVDDSKNKLKKYSNMTLEDYIKDLEREAKHYFRDLKAQQEFKRANPPDPEIVKEIFDCFDRWIDAPDGYGKMFDFNHSFEEPWFWGAVAPGSNPKYYTRKLSRDQGDHIKYGAVFDACSVRCKEKMKADHCDYPGDVAEVNQNDDYEQERIQAERIENLKREIVPIYNEYRESQERGNRIY